MTPERRDSAIGNLPAGPFKVSVVVPTYCPGDDVNRLVHSLETQTLSTDDFEVIFVDDGSPDDTWDVLGEVVDRHTNMVAYRLPHSGWPSAARNLGIDRARGTYIAFADHDDMFYPDALRAAHDYAESNGADILNGKETQTSVPSWGIDSYRQNMPNTLGRKDPHPLAPMNPHKMYRTSFLRKNSIRFPEGRRNLYEDNLFNIDALSCARVISTLADTPYYHWYRTGKPTASGTFRDDPEEFWAAIRRVIDRAYEKLAKPEQGEILDLMILYQYRLRVIGYFNHRYLARSRERNEASIRHIERIVAELVPDRIDLLLSAPDRLKAHLIREGRWAELADLSGWEPELTGTARAENAHWDSGELVVAGTMTWRDNNGNPPALRMVDGRILRVVPARVEQVVPPELLDMTDHVQQRVGAEFGLRSRSSKEVWLARTSQSLELVAGKDGRVDVVVTFVGRINPETEAMGRRLNSGVWDINARATWHSSVQQRGVHYDKAARTAIFDRSAIAYSTNQGRLALDLGGTVRSVVRSGWSGRSVARRGRFIQLRLDRVAHVRNGEVLYGSVQLQRTGFSKWRSALDRMARIGRRRPAVVRTKAGKAELTFPGLRAAGLYSVHVEIEGRRVELEQRLVISNGGGVAIQQHKKV